MEQLKVFETSSKRVRVNWNLEVLVFKERRKNPRSEGENQQQTKPTYDFEPGPHWWEAGALTTAPTLLPKWSMAVKQQHKPDEMVANDISMG